MDAETCYLLPPSEFYSMRQDQELTNTFEQNLATLARNPELPPTGSDPEAIALAIQGLTSGTGTPTRGTRLRIIVAEMRMPGHKLLIHSGTGLLTMYGTAEQEITETELRQGTMIRAKTGKLPARSPRNAVRQSDGETLK